MSLEKLFKLVEGIKDLFKLGGAPFVYALLFGAAVSIHSHKMLKYIKESHAAEIERMSNQLNWFRDNMLPGRISTVSDTPDEEE